MAVVRMVRAILTILSHELRGLIVFDQCVSLLDRRSVAVAMTGAGLAVVMMRVAVVGMLGRAHYNASELL